MEFTDVYGLKLTVYDKLGMIAVNGKLIKPNPHEWHYMFNRVIRRELRDDGREYFIQPDGSIWRIFDERRTIWTGVSQPNGRMFLQQVGMYEVFFRDMQENGFANTLCIPYYVIWTLEYVEWLNPLFRRLQRWMKKMIRRCRHQRLMLAAAMAFHPRLGQHSGLAVLGCDCIAAVSGCLTKYE